MDIYLLCLVLSILLLLTYQANKRLNSIRTGYLLIDLPILLVVLSVTMIFELLVSLLPLYARRKQNLVGRVALVTGAGSGIGRETSLQLSRKGCVLVLWDINEGGNNTTRRMIEAIGGTAYEYTVDVSNRYAREEAAEAVLREHSRVDILVCNAGITKIHRLHKMEHQGIERLIAVNFISIVWLTKFFLMRMVEQDYGHIACISSVSGLRGTSHTSDYAASKAALSSYAISLMGELDRIQCKNVHVSVVYPAAVRTPPVQKVIEIIPQLYPVTASFAAEQIVNGILLKKEIITIPRIYKLFNFLTFLMPVALSNSLISIFDFEKVAIEIEKC